MGSVYRQNIAEIATEEFEDGPVMINFLTGRYFTLNRAGHRLWSVLKAGADDARLVSVLADPPSLPAAEVERIGQDVRSFLDTLIKERLLAEVIGAAPIQSPAPVRSGRA